MFWLGADSKPVTLTRTSIKESFVVQTRSPGAPHEPHPRQSDFLDDRVFRGHCACATGNSEPAGSSYGFQRSRDCRRQHNRSEEHTSELQSRFDLVCRLLLEKKKKKQK